MSRPTRKMVNLSIEETSGVDHPAHLHEGWLVMKAVGGDAVEDVLKAAQMKTEDGVEYPAAAFAYVPDPESPSTWKLRLWEDPEQKVTARQVGMAVAALGAGFRGNKVQIPAEDMAGVKAKVRSAWSEANPDRGDDEMPPVLKSTESEDPMDLEVDQQDGVTEEKPSYEDLADSLAKAEERIAELEKAAVEKAAEPSEEFLKEAPEEVVKAFEDMRKAIEDARVEKEAAEAELRKEREERADADSVVKAREAFAALGLDAEKVGPALRRLGETDADLAKSVEDILTAANAKVESGDIFAEIGKSATLTGGNAYERAEAMAKAAVEAGSAPTFEQALSEVFLKEKDLYTSYLAEQGK